MSDYKEQIEAAKAALEAKTTTEETSEPVSISETVEVEVDPLEKEARDSGWTNKEEWVKAGKDERLWKPADQFVKDGSFFRKIELLKKDNDEIKSLLKQTFEHNAKLEKAAYEKALRDIQAQKLQAVQEGDTTKYLEMEQQVELAKKAIEGVKVPEVVTPPVEQPKMSPRVEEFRQKHQSWLTGTDSTDVQMQAYVKSQIQFFMDTGRANDEEGCIKELEEDLQRKFPSKFKNEKQERPARVMSSTTSRESSGSNLASKLNETQLKFLRSAQKMGSKMTAEDYAKQLKTIGALRDE